MTRAGQSGWHIRRIPTTIWLYTADSDLNRKSLVVKTEILFDFLADNGHLISLRPLSVLTRFPLVNSLVLPVSVFGTVIIIFFAAVRWLKSNLKKQQKRAEDERYVAQLSENRRKLHYGILELNRERQKTAMIERKARLRFESLASRFLMLLSSHRRAAFEEIYQNERTKASTKKWLNEQSELMAQEELAQRQQLTTVTTPAIPLLVEPPMLTDVIWFNYEWLLITHKLTQFRPSPSSAEVCLFEAGIFLQIDFDIQDAVAMMGRKIYDPQQRLHVIQTLDLLIEQASVLPMVMVSIPTLAVLTAVAAEAGAVDLVRKAREAATRLAYAQLAEITKCGLMCAYALPLLLLDSTAEAAYEILAGISQAARHIRQPDSWEERHSFAPQRWAILVLSWPDMTYRGRKI